MRKVLGNLQEDLRDQNPREEEKQLRKSAKMNLHHSSKRKLYESVDLGLPTDLKNNNKKIPVTDKTYLKNVL